MWAQSKAMQQSCQEVQFGRQSIEQHHYLTDLNEQCHQRRLKPNFAFVFEHRTAFGIGVAHFGL